MRTQAELAEIGPGATVGPFSFLRPGTRLGADGKIGGFVETKNAQIGDGAKVPHLAYCGDATVGPGANIGAGTIFANYDGLTKSHTTVGAHSFVGSNSVIVAPRDHRRRRLRRRRLGRRQRRRARPARRHPGPAAQHRRLGRAPPRRHATDEAAGRARSAADDPRRRPAGPADRRRPREQPSTEPKDANG